MLRSMAVGDATAVIRSSSDNGTPVTSTEVNTGETVSPGDEPIIVTAVG